MGLKCSLLGHDYGDVEVERSREEQGNEVVETVREVKRCERCGAESVVSENTEVRTAIDAEEVGVGPGGDAAEDEQTPGGGESEGEGDLVSAVSQVDDRSGGGSSTGSAAADAAGGESRFDDVTAGDAADHPRVDDGGEFEPETDAAEDDAIILDDDDEEEEEESEERAPGQWPAADDTRQAERDADATRPPLAESASDGESENENENEQSENASNATEESGANGASDAAGTDAATGSWPDHDGGEDEGFTAEPGGSTSEAEVSAGQPSPADEAEGGTEDGFDAEFIDGDGSGVTSDDAAADDEGTGLTCPECGFDPGPSPSLRPGDICPECHRGYLSDGTSE